MLPAGTDNRGDVTSPRRDSAPYDDKDVPVHHYRLSPIFDRAAVRAKSQA
jgi:hypothetical protein